MGAYTTLRITRKKAIAILLEKLTNGISNEELERFMDQALGPRLFNAIIVRDDDAENDDDVV
jgi:hypothetical protein